MKDNEVLTAWKINRSAGTNIPPHSHECYELVYYVFGAGETRIGDDVYLFKTGNFAVIPPEKEHSEIHYEDGIVICIGFNSNIPLNSNIYFDRYKAVYNIINSVLTESQEQQTGYVHMLYAKILELITLIHRNERQHNSKQKSKDFQYAIKYLNENFHEKIVFENLAHELNYGYDYFHHRFKEITGYSPRKYVLNLRLDKAMELLKCSSLNCTEIAYRCGFSTSSQFTMLFKLNLGITPSDYRVESSVNVTV